MMTDDANTFALGAASPRTFVDIAQGHYNTAMLTADGEVSVVGVNNHGVLNVPSFSHPVVDLERGGHYMFSAKLTNGQVVAWGHSGCDQANSSWYSSKLDYSTGVNYAVGIAQDSTLSFLGCNNHGVGNLPAGSNYTKVWTSIWEHYWAGALRSDGTAVMWGRNYGGNLAIPSDLGQVVDIEGGSYWTLALRADGSLRAWGYNEQNVVSSTPTGNDFIQIAAGYYHGLALRADGSVVAWGHSTPQWLKSEQACTRAGPLRPVDVGISGATTRAI
jgi:alpha-tubulin suppressor-like RCC1 family protein